MESKPPTIAAAAAAAIPTIMRGLRNHRSWVQIPPGPYFQSSRIRYYFEFIFGNCQTNSAAKPNLLPSTFSHASLETHVQAPLLPAICR